MELRVSFSTISQLIDLSGTSHHTVSSAIKIVQKWTYPHLGLMKFLAAAVASVATLLQVSGQPLCKPAMHWPGWYLTPLYPETPRLPSLQNNTKLTCLCSKHSFNSRIIQHNWCFSSHKSTCNRGKLHIIVARVYVFNSNIIWCTEHGRQGFKNRSRYASSRSGNATLGRKVNFASFLCPVFAASRVQYISDLHSKFALRPHHVWKYGIHPICGGWD